MEPFRKVRSIVTPLEKANVDTDQILPKQFLKLVQKSGFGRFLFYDWRYDGDERRAGFVLNDPRYDGSRILVAGENFGCGSSREHAVWALMDYGFAVVIAPSFADIFFSNCFKNGLLPVSLGQQDVSGLQAETGEVEVDLECQVVRAGGAEIRFDIPPHRKRVLLEGLDDIALTLKLEEEISRFEQESKVPSVL